MEIQLGQRLREVSGPVLVTGHTGFKGTWMTLLLEYLKVPIIGYSLPAEQDSLHARLQLSGLIPEKLKDILDYQVLEEFMDMYKPSSIVHMAAQPIVKESYNNPRKTFDVNIMGTVNLLDIAFKKNYVKAIIVVTSDKVYRNDDSGKFFNENDPLEGKDPYSASKVGTEAVVAAWQQIQKKSGGPALVSVRAGNVIGGGDFARYRIIPDLIRGVLNKETVYIRNPYSTRPWQHVLDPICGYVLTLESALNGENFYNLNFGPLQDNLSVLEIVEIAKRHFNDLQISINSNSQPHETEAQVLNVNSIKAASTIKWKPKWTQVESVDRTFLWWKNYQSSPYRLKEICIEEIVNYFKTN